jgi:cell division septation protein DedD
LADRSKTDAALAGFKKLLRDQDGKKAMSEYENEAAAVRAKTERLRALRLARDSAEAKAAPAEPAPSKKPVKQAKTKQAKKPAGSLSDWLKDREGSGHNN